MSQSFNECVGTEIIMSMSKVRKMNVLRTMVQENISYKKPYRSLVNELTRLKYRAFCKPVSEETVIPPINKNT